MTKLLIVPAPRVRSVPVVIREDGSTFQPPGTLLVADDGTEIAAVSDVLTGEPVREPGGASSPRVAYAAQFSDAAIAAVRSKLAGASASESLPHDWRTAAQPGV